jgi:LacI family transcriptional regulator
MKFEAVTIKDIAKALGLSTSTVSRALRDSYEISEETKQLVLNYAKEINYRPNPIALSLKEKKSRTIGVVVSEIANSFFSQIINGIESIAHNKGYNVIITQSLESYEREVANMQFLSSRSIDGCLVSVSVETNNYDHILDLHKRGFNIVSFDRIIDPIETHKVKVDNFKGAYDATEHLINSGYKNIAILVSGASLSITKERLAGYQKALDDHNIPFNDKYLKVCSHAGMTYEEVEQAMNELMTMKPKLDAVFSASDKLTTSLVKYCKQKKINIPETIGVIGFSNVDFMELLTPALSVVRQPAFEMGRTATELLLKMIESKRPVTDFENIILHTQLIVRDSSVKKK